SANEGGYTFPGEGMLTYPGEHVGVDGPIPSIRLKALRKGVEDYEYVELLKRAGRGDWAMHLVKEVASDWNSWTRTPAALEGVRQEMGAELDRLATGRETGHRDYQPGAGGRSPTPKVRAVE